LATARTYQDAQAHSDTDQRLERAAFASQEPPCNWQGPAARQTAINAEEPEGVIQDDGFATQDGVVLRAVVIGCLVPAGSSRSDHRAKVFDALCPVTGPPIAPPAIAVGGSAHGRQRDSGPRSVVGNPAGCLPDAVRFFLCHPVVISLGAQPAVQPLKGHFAATVVARRCSRAVHRD